MSTQTSAAEILKLAGLQTADGGALRVCDRCGRPFVQHRPGDAQVFCARCQDIKQRRPSVVENREELAVLEGVTVESLPPGNWTRFQARVGDEPRVKMDYRAGGGRLVVWAREEPQAGDVVRVRHMRATHRQQDSDATESHEYVALDPTGGAPTGARLLWGVPAAAGEGEAVLWERTVGIDFDAEDPRLMVLGVPAPLLPAWAEELLAQAAQRGACADGVEQARAWALALDPPLPEEAPDAAGRALLFAPLEQVVPDVARWLGENTSRRHRRRPLIALDGTEEDAPRIFSPDDDDDLSSYDEYED